MPKGDPAAKPAPGAANGSTPARIAQSQALEDIDDDDPAKTNDDLVE
jgi:hypothetical protein